MDGLVGLLLVLGIVFAIAKYLQAGGGASRRAEHPITGWTPPTGTATAVWQAPASPPNANAPAVVAADPQVATRLEALERAVQQLQARHDALAAALDRVAVAERVGPDAGAGRPVPIDAPGSSAVLADVRRLLAEGRKIEAIRVYREATGVGLGEAKDVVEAFEGGLPG